MLQCIFCNDAIDLGYLPGNYRFKFTVQLAPLITILLNK